jgi:hypothetical protein
VVVGEAKPDLRGKELTREMAYEKTHEVERPSRLLSKHLDTGGKDRSCCLLSKQLNQSKIVWLDWWYRAVRPPCLWSPKDAYSKAVRD